MYMCMEVFGSAMVPLEEKITLLDGWMNDLRCLLGLYYGAPLWCLGQTKVDFDIAVGCDATDARRGLYSISLKGVQ